MGSEMDENYSASEGKMRMDIADRVAAKLCIRFSVRDHCNKAGR